MAQSLINRLKDFCSFKEKRICNYTNKCKLYQQIIDTAIEYIKSNGIPKTEYDGNVLVEDSITYNRDEITEILKILEVEDE